MQGKKKALGRGLSALLDNGPSEIAGNEYTSMPVPNMVSSILLNHIDTNPQHGHAEKNADFITKMFRACRLLVSFYIIQDKLFSHNQDKDYG